MDSDIVQAISTQTFRRIVEAHYITVSIHALDRLNAAQRQIFHEATLIRILVQETPRFVGLQQNGRYAAFFRKKSGFIKIVTEIKGSELEIVTFMKTEGIPSLWQQRN